MTLKDSQRFLSEAARKKRVQTTAAGLGIAALVGAAAGFSLAVKLEKHKRKIESGCHPVASNADRVVDDTSDEAIKTASHEEH